MRFTLMVVLPGMTKTEEDYFRSERWTEKLLELAGDQVKARQDADYRKWRLWNILEEDAPQIEKHILNTNKVDGPKMTGWDDGEEFEYTSQIPNAEVSTIKLYTDQRGRAGIREEFEKLRPREGRPTRLMIFGHGSGKNISGCAPSALAALLHDNGMPRGITGDFKVSLVACYGARRLAANVDVDGSYADLFHKVLKTKYGTECTLSARTGVMKLGMTSNGTWAKKVHLADDPQRKGEGFLVKQPGTKYVWKWTRDGGREIRDAYENVLFKTFPPGTNNS